MLPADTPASLLSREDFDRIRPLCILRSFGKDELIFSDGDSADYIYFIESGHVYIFIEKFTRREEISALGAGEYFGEMAFFSGDRRTASAAALLDSTVLLLDKQSFLALFESDQALAGKINRNFDLRNRDLTSKENLAGPGEGLSLGIKGDPSLRETASPANATTARSTRSFPIFRRDCTICWCIARHMRYSSTATAANRAYVPSSTHWRTRSTRLPSC